MKALFDSIPDNIYLIVSDYAKILVPSFITYLVTRYSLSRPHKYEIKKQQFDFVYLPLYLLTLQYISCKMDDLANNLPVYLKKVDRLIYKNYPYVYPKTLRLLTELKIESSKEHINMYFVSRFEYQVIAHYNILKKELGYPCDSVISRIKQTNRMEHVLFFANFVFLISFIFSAANFFLSLFNGQITDLFLALFTSSICALMLYIFHNITRH